MPVYAADGSWNIRVVDGTTFVGAYATDGALNVKVAAGADKGAHHASGARLVTVGADPGPLYSALGILRVSVSPYVDGTQPVTVLSGALA